MELSTTLSDEQIDELSLFDAMKKSEKEFKWSVNGAGEANGLIMVSVDLPQTPIAMSMYLPATYKKKNSSSNKRGQPTDVNRHESFEVTHLPSISLHFQLPKDYPEKAPPIFSLCCSWLNFTQLTVLCRKLDQIWLDNSGAVILYSWQQYIKEESLSTLGFTERITMEYQNPKQCKTQADWDPRAVQDIDHPLHLVPSLIEFNESKLVEEFESSRFNCEICFLSELGSNCIKLNPCSHVHCKGCMSAHITAKIADGAVNKLDCPAMKCEALVTPDIVQSLVSTELFKRYDELLLKRTLDKMSDIVNCPRQSCMCTTIKEDDSEMAVCPRCKFTFCCLCRRTWHGISPCKLLPDDVLDLKQLYESGDAELRLSLERQYGQKNLLKAFEEADSKVWLKQNSKKCPNCQSSIEKTHGCNKMTCTSCHAHFCWLCEALLNGHNPYAHFHFGSSACAGKLFDGIIDEPEFN